MTTDRLSQNELDDILIKNNQVFQMFGINLQELHQTSEYMFNLKTNHRKAVLCHGEFGDVVNFNILKFKNGKIQPKVKLHESLTNIIEIGNQYVDFFEGVRLFSHENNKMYSYDEYVQPFIDFELNWKDSDDHVILLNFSHPKSYISSLVSNKEKIVSGGNGNIYIAFDLNGNIKINRLNDIRKKAIAAWDGILDCDSDTPFDFKYYGVLTEMINV